MAEQKEATSETDYFAILFEGSRGVGTTRRVELIVDIRHQRHTNFASLIHGGSSPYISRPATCRSLHRAPEIDLRGAGSARRAASASRPLVSASTV